ncbi:26S proteasome non-ATPase regulatory subunit 12 [Hondaea fermentalgiana]|uniref:26S proteasome non-ATPase regulatory subunit 12 n=1 Tax=Hondaea fermentalgiana TaxID=2315210 RepID=A0A2R5GTV2_9STRA|nr:26S proteasome non-ATPase regulatory subunit 12 [Hondaea fermentalgiana]|eukprot:GBG34292.1 26S proteasome non-ATPase regulatory subunit 12 [Hondaea fermentalgiana]
MPIDPLSEGKEDTGPDSYVLDKEEKKKKDFSDESRVEIPEATDMARDGDLSGALERLLALEKRARLGGDVRTVSETALVIVKLCFELEHWEELNANITLLCKRRGQYKQVQVKVIQEGAERVSKIKDKGVKLQLIETLRTVSEGKIYVEAERARLTMELSRMKEAEGDIASAADILQEEQVETYGAMNKREKLDYLLEQVRLCLDKQDYVRALIIAKKVNRKTIEEGDLEDIKVRFYRLLIRYYSHEKDPLELARAYSAIFRTPGIQEHPEDWEPELTSAVVMLAISPFDNHQVDLVHKMLQEEKLEQLPEYKSLLTHFVTDELAQWPLPEHESITQHPLLADSKDWYLPMLRDRVIQHDIRVVAKFYTRISAARLAQMLQLSKDESEKYLCDMVTSTTSERLIAKIDRPAGVITFRGRKTANDHLSEWTADISELLGLVEKTCHIIHKEHAIHKAHAAQRLATDS